MIVYKNNNRYSFRIGNFDSSKSYFIFPHVKSSYKYAWMAERDARIILKNMRSVLASETDAEESEPFDKHNIQTAEDMIVSHYLRSYDVLVDKSEGVKDGVKEDRKKVYDEIKLVVEGLLRVQEGIEEAKDKQKIDEIIGRFSRLTKENFNDLLSEDREKTAVNSLERYLYASSTDMFTEDEIREVIEDFSQKACKALQDKMPDVCYMIDHQRRKATLVACDRNIKYATLLFDSDLLLSRILPHSYLSPNNSGDFYQNILKPIFESVGHFKVSSKGVLLVCGKTYLPDLSENDASFDVDAIDTETKQPCSITISFSNKKWKSSKKLAKCAQSKYTEMDYTENGGAIVECIDQELESIFGRRGHVKQVVPDGVTVYVDVDFGNAIVRLTEPQIKIIKDEIQTVP